jgi:hypothetical protein
MRKDEGVGEQVLGWGWCRFSGAEDTSARRAEARAVRPGVSKSLRAVMDAYLPDFGIENL